jgi:penicillin-binding protein 1A
VAILPLVVVVAAGLVAAGLFPAIAGLGSAITKFDRQFLGGGAVEIPPFAERSTIYAADGTVLATVAEFNRAYVPLADIPQVARDAVLAIEDDGFYEHGAVDAFSILRAALANLQAGKVVQGGSTITQQLVKKKTAVGEEQTFARKFKEAQAAIQLERQYSKDQILELYLNEVYFGHGAYGIQAASEYYFAKPAKDLTLPQAALLAGLIQSPATWDPIRHKDAAVIRRNQVLSRMLDLGWINSLDHQDAVDRNIKLSGKLRTVNALGPEPYFVQFVKDQILHPDKVFPEGDPRREQYFEAFGETYKERERALFQGGLNIYTTLQPKLQATAAKAVTNQLPNQGPTPPDDPQGGVVTIVPQTGAIQVMYGGRNFELAKFNLATQSQRTAGSAFKAFTLAAALEEGFPVGQIYNTPNPVTIPEEKCPNIGGPWMPHNAEESSGGLMNMTTATAHSVNVYFAQLIADVGPATVAEVADRMGVRSYARDAGVTVDSVCAITLGAVAVNPLSMTSGFSTLANQGKHCLPFAIRRVTDAKGKGLLRARPVCEQVIDKKVAAQVTALLEGVVTSGTATIAQLGRPVAGKTGTGQDYRDAWFVGYIPQMVTGVWVGYSKALIPMRGLRVLGGGNAFGGTIAAPIWKALMLEAIKGLPVKDFPAPPPPEAGKVPDVVGLPQGQAEQILSRAHFTPRAVPMDSNQPEGIVAAQAPSGGAQVPLGSIVTIYVSTGESPKTTVPNVVGLTEEAATKRLLNAGYGVSIHYQPVQQQANDGIVLAQNPTGGTNAQPGSTVNIVVGKDFPGPSPSPNGGGGGGNGAPNHKQAL